ncbi:MAG: hypothetical protein WCY08_06055 [Rhodocyclaceae bacterium]
MRRSLYRLPAFRRLALSLAWLALVAQVCIGLVSAQHHAQMLNAGERWMNICSPNGLDRADLLALLAELGEDEDSLVAEAAPCVICAVAALPGLAPQTHTALFSPQDAHPLRADSYLPARHTATRLLPPSRAPPLA